MSNPTPAPATSPAAAAAPATAETKPSFKQKLTAALANFKAKLKKPKAEVKKPTVDVKLALKNLGKDIASIPMLMVKGDALTRLAVVGFTVSLLLLIRVIPELPPLVARLLGRPVAEAPSHAEAWSGGGTSGKDEHHGMNAAAMGTVVFVGAFSGEFKPAIPYSAELFAELDSEESAAKLRASLETAKPALQKILDGQLAADLESKEGREELLGHMKEALGDGAVAKLFFTKFEMQAATAQGEGAELPAAAAPAPLGHH